MSKISIYLVIGFILLLGEYLWSIKDERSVAFSAGSLSLPEASFNFQTISMSNGLVSHDFQVKNESSEIVRIEKVSTSCMCTKAILIDSSGKEAGPFGMGGMGGFPWTNLDIAPGQTVTVKAVFDPAAHGPAGVGPISRSVFLETNSQKSPKVELQFSAIVTS